MTTLEVALLEERIERHLIDGDLQEAATVLLKGYGPQILSYLILVLRDRHDAFEVFGQFRENLWKGLERFRRECPFRIWAYRLAVNATKSYQRRAEWKRLRRLESTEISQIAEVVRSSTAPYLKPAANDRLARLRESLDP